MGEYEVLKRSREDRTVIGPYRARHVVDIRLFGLAVSGRQRRRRARRLFAGLGEGPYYRSRAK